MSLLDNFLELLDTGKEAAAVEAVCQAWELATGGKPTPYRQPDGTYRLIWEGQEKTDAANRISALINRPKTAGKYQAVLTPIIMPGAIKKSAPLLAGGAIILAVSKRRKRRKQ